MNSKSFFSFLVIACFPAIVFAQTTRLVNSTIQTWSGGIAGHSGENYTFCVEFSDFKTEPVPDTLWIGQNPVAIVLMVGNYGQDANTKLIRTKRSVRFEIRGGVSRDEYADRYPVMGNEPKVKPHSPVSYKGVALLSYKYNGRQRYFEISKIMKTFEPVNYP